MLITVSPPARPLILDLMIWTHRIQVLEAILGLCTATSGSRRPQQNDPSGSNRLADECQNLITALQQQVKRPVPVNTSAATSLCERIIGNPSLIRLGKSCPSSGNSAEHRGLC